MADSFPPVAPCSAQGTKGPNSHEKGDPTENQRQDRAHSPKKHAVAFKAHYPCIAWLERPIHHSDFLAHNRVLVMVNGGPGDMDQSVGRLKLHCDLSVGCLPDIAKIDYRSGGMFTGPRQAWDPEVRAERTRMQEERRAAWEAAQAEDNPTF